MSEDLFPESKWVEVNGGRHQVRIDPWTMAVRRKLKPHIKALVEKTGGGDALQRQDLLVWLIDEGGDHIEEVAEGSICAYSEGFSFDDLWAEDLPIIVQAVVEVVFLRSGGAGILGKGIRALAAFGRAAPRPRNGNSTSPKPPDSPSSPGDGDPPPRSSAMS